MEHRAPATQRTVRRKYALLHSDWLSANVPEKGRSSGARTVRVADILIIYTSSDSEWATWIAHELEALHHTPHIHEWEVRYGGDIMAWMKERHDAADHTLCIVSEAYLHKPYSSLERRAEQRAANDTRPHFLLPVFVEKCKVPPRMAKLKPCELYDLAEEDVRARIRALCGPAGKTQPKIIFPGNARHSTGQVPLTPSGLPVNEAALSRTYLRATSDDSDQPAESAPNPEHLVILVHGINTWANWMSDVKRVLEDAGFAVAATSYGKFSVLLFLAPIPWARHFAIERVAADIRTAKRRYEKDTRTGPKRMSVISHSFGTYIVSRILTDKPEFKWHRIIFCGSVVRDDYPFERAEDRFDNPLLNEVGTNDYWPALGSSAGWGYGSPGSHGLNHPLAETRWHHGFRHSDFLTGNFCTKFWIPFLRGEKLLPADKAENMPAWIRTLAMLPLRWIILVCSLGAFSWLARFVYKIIVVLTMLSTSLPTIVVTTAQSTAFPQRALHPVSIFELRCVWGGYGQYFR